MKIVPRLSEEKLIEELLATNDDMNTAFTRYHRLTTFIIIFSAYLSANQVDGDVLTGSI